MNPDCDIIIPVWNQLSFTKDCINSIEKYTKTPYRLIIIDNASDGDTKRYLEDLKKRGPSVILERNGENVGFVKAVNQGIRLSTAPYICILNNDTLVTEGWLSEMINIAESDREIGIVNPSSNNLGQKPQRGEPLELFAEKIRQLSGRFTELGSAVGFCMLIKRQVIERVGVFDEIYGMGNFEDTDFSRRAVKDGYRCVRANGAYVYHRENSSFRKIKTFDEDFRRNREIYEFRWGKPKRIAYILDIYDDNTLRRLEAESVKLARSGNWIWYFLKDKAKTPDHSNIIRVELQPENFYLNTIFMILKKKKKFDEIFVGGARLGSILDFLSFMHRAKIRYY